MKWKSLVELIEFLKDMILKYNVILFNNDVVIMIMCKLRRKCLK